MLMLVFPDYQPQAERLAARLAMPTANVHIHQFPDGESLVRLPPTLPEHVLICRSLNQPNDKLIELLFCQFTTETTPRHFFEQALNESVVWSWKSQVPAGHKDVSYLCPTLYITEVAGEWIKLFSITRLSNFNSSCESS